MSLVRIAVPESEPHLALMTSALESAGIPYFVHGAHLGSLLPGLAINSYNSRALMVPESAAEEALQVLGELHFSHAEEESTPAKGGWLRLLIEALFFGWFVPSRRPKPGRDDS
jgi:hypothetical protein